MASVTLEEKRLKQLKQQLFGKEQPVTIKASRSPSHQVDLGISSKHAAVQATVINSTSLRTDLIKIMVFSTVAITIQFLLFFAYKQGLVRFF